MSEELLGCVRQGHAIGRDGSLRRFWLGARRKVFANIDPAFNSSVRRCAKSGIVQSGAASAAVIEFAAFEALRGASEEANVTLINLSTLD